MQEEMAQLVSNRKPLPHNGFVTIDTNQCVAVLPN